MMRALDVRARRYRVAIVAACPFPTLQGSQLLIRKLAQGLRARGHDPVVVTYAEGLEEALAGLPVRRIPRLPGLCAAGSGPSAAKLVLDAALLVRLVRVLEREGIEVMHAHNYEAALVGLAARRRTGVPLVYHSHNALAEELPTYFRSRTARRLARALGAVADREVPRRADRCIAICRELVGFLRARGVEEDAIALIAPGSSPEEFPACSLADLAAIRERFGFGERPVLLYTGNVDGYQNLDLLLASIGLVRRSVGDALLVLATHVAPRDLPARLRRLPDGVRLVSADDFATVRDLIRVADLALCPRREWSGFPMKLLNYMAAAKAVVVSAGSAKAVRDGVNGVVVDVDGPDAYAAAVVGLLADPRRRRALGAAARRTVEDEYGWERVIDQVEATYDVVLRRRPTSEAAPAAAALGVFET
ncbi:MAG: glycosyltransferase family 4 protein [Deltaproteobacteria bacterium]|nr:glycosyltransferase family 4 protein [Deltaproteobacteria bacterium]